MKYRLLQNILFATLLAFTVNSFVYFGFVNSYSSSILNYQNFSEQFHSGIYQYRILSASLLFWIYDFLTSLGLNYDVFKFKFLNPESEPQMYFAFYLLNTFFFMLSVAAMVLITETKSFVATETEKLLLILLGIFSIAITQFVILPYDCSSYFFLLLFFWFFIKYLQKRTNGTLFLLLILIIFSTLNRESSALSLSLAATLLFAESGLNKKFLLPISILGIVFLATYLGMRFFSSSFSTNDGKLLTENFTQPKNYLGILFWMVFFGLSLLLASNKKAKQNILIFHLFALPYIVMCFYSGILYETRLYIPIFLTSLFLAKTKIPNIH